MVKVLSGNLIVSCKWSKMSKVYCTISKEIQFDAGHRVPNHTSKCCNPHGHRYRIVVHCRGYIVQDAKASDDGMLIDFGALKVMLSDLIHDPLDHGFIVYRHDFICLTMFEAVSPQQFKLVVFPYVPTAENIARWCWDELTGPISKHFRENLELESIECWETPTSQAVYKGGT